MTIRKISSFEHKGITVKIKKREDKEDYGYDAGMGVAGFGCSTPEEAENKAMAVLDSMRKSR
jgi:hypothetical protein